MEQEKINLRHHNFLDHYMQIKVHIKSLALV